MLGQIAQHQEWGSRLILCLPLGPVVLKFPHLEEKVVELGPHFPNCTTLCTTRLTLFLQVSTIILIISKEAALFPETGKPMPSAIVWGGG